MCRFDGLCGQRLAVGAVAIDHLWLEAAGETAKALGQLHDLDRAGPVGQPPDEATLLQRRDQAVNAGLRPQVERLLHFVETRGTPSRCTRRLMKSRRSSCFLVNMR